MIPTKLAAVMDNPVSPVTTKPLGRATQFTAILHNTQLSTI